MRKIVILVIACVAALCLAGVVAAFGLAPKPVTGAGSETLPTTLPTHLDTANPTATPAPPGTPFTVDATLGDIPNWISPTYELSRAHSIHVWLATAKCMQKLGYSDFHYRVYWMPAAITRDSENFWTDGMDTAKATKALTDEFGPTHMSESSTGCHGRTATALQQQFLDGK